MIELLLQERKMYRSMPLETTSTGKKELQLLQVSMKGRKQMLAKKTNTPLILLYNVHFITSHVKAWALSNKRQNSTLSTMLSQIVLFKSLEIVKDITKEILRKNLIQSR